MKIATTLFLFVVVGCTWRETLAFCVLNSDLGFYFNCTLKKSGLFRVRNLGGVKGYFGIGLSFGDELGFPDSLSNAEPSRRRSIKNRSGNTYTKSKLDNNNDIRQASPRYVPPFKPLPPSRTLAQQPEKQHLIFQQNISNPLKSMQSTSPYAALQHEAKLRQQMRYQQELIAMQILKQQKLQQQEAARLMQMQKFQQHQQMMEMGESQNPKLQIAAAVPGGIIVPVPIPNVISSVPQSNKPTVIAAMPPFVSMPASTSQLTDRISNSPSILEDSSNDVSDENSSQSPLRSEDVAVSVNQLANTATHPVYAENQTSSQPESVIQQIKKASLPSMEPIQGMHTSLKALAQASNITLEALETAIMLRQQQLLEKQQGLVPTTSTTTTSTTSTTTTQPPRHRKISNGATKVMNAPKEYYPVGYDKNFDDNFASRVDLPHTSFNCGYQKHFPGLYADEDLGCMVFHVCALTDDGLIMKSFLCPESTLFDQTILKCNWWFYVDCKTSKTLYDSNIPISKSYQLMKALAFFSAYKSSDNSSTVPANETKQT